MKKIKGDNFCDAEKYKLYRNVYDILHPTISKKNISNYKVVLDEKLLPVLVFYPKKISNISSVMIYVPSDGRVSGNYGKYSDICKNLASESNSIVIAIDYFNSAIKYPTIVNKLSKLIKYLYEELDKNNIDSGRITLMSDSVGCKILGSVVTKLINKDVLVNKLVMLYPVVRDDYNEYKWNESLMSINFNLDKKVNDYLKKYLPKDDDNNCDLMEMVYFKEFPKTLVITGDMDIFKDDGEVLADKIIKIIEGSIYKNIKFASHGFLGTNDEEIKREAYKIISEFVL